MEFFFFAPPKPPNVADDAGAVVFAPAEPKPPNPVAAGFAELVVPMPLKEVELVAPKPPKVLVAEGAAEAAGG